MDHTVFFDEMFMFVSLKEKERKDLFCKFNKNIDYSGYIPIRFSHKKKGTDDTLHFIFKLMEDNTVKDGYFTITHNIDEAIQLQ